MKEEQKEKLTWDGKPMLPAEELARQKALFAPLQDDMWEWQKTFTDAERELQEAWEAKLRIPDDEEGGTQARETF